MELFQGEGTAGFVCHIPSVYAKQGLCGASRDICQLCVKPQTVVSTFLG